jgi:phage protein D
VQQYYVPDFEVKIQGLTMEADVKSAVISLTYDNNLDQADMFQLTLNNADLRFTDSPLFDVGKDAEIYMGYANNLQPMMLGEIVAVRPSFPEGGAPTITITGYDKSHRMRHNHKTRAFHFANASLIAAQIAAENLLVPVVDPTSLSFACKTQNSSDMAF